MDSYESRMSSLDHRERRERIATAVLAGFAQATLAAVYTSKASYDEIVAVLEKSKASYPLWSIDWADALMEELDK